jgi:hypothetical protein
VVAISETAALSKRNGSIGAKVHEALLLVGLAFAMILTEAWTGLLGYCILSLGLLHSDSYVTRVECRRRSACSAQPSGAYKPSIYRAFLAELQPEPSLLGHAREYFASPSSPKCPVFAPCLYCYGDLS